MQPFKLVSTEMQNGWDERLSFGQYLTKKYIVTSDSNYNYFFGCCKWSFLQCIASVHPYCGRNSCRSPGHVTQRHTLCDRLGGNSSKHRTWYSFVIFNFSLLSGGLFLKEQKQNKKQKNLYMRSYKCFAIFSPLVQPKRSSNVNELD